MRFPHGFLLCGSHEAVPRVFFFVHGVPPLSLLMRSKRFTASKGLEPVRLGSCWPPPKHSDQVVRPSRLSVPPAGLLSSESRLQDRCRNARNIAVYPSEQVHRHRPSRVLRVTRMGCRFLRYRVGRFGGRQRMSAGHLCSHSRGQSGPCPYRVRRYPPGCSDRTRPL